MTFQFKTRTAGFIVYRAAAVVLTALLFGFGASAPLWGSGSNSGDDVKIPACLLSYKFGPEQHILIVEKSTQTLFVYSNYKPEPLERFTITTGKQNGRKIQEGDLKTPEGLYFFKRILVGDQLPKVDDYGEKAFTLNYPNPIDKKEDRNGSGIWLHGAFAEDKTDNPNNSRGCVVLKNDDLQKISRYIFLNKTPICIYDEIRFDSVANVRGKRDRLIQYLKEWKTQWENKNINGYIGYYTDDFSYRGMNLSRFKTYKDQLNQSYRFIKITLSDINIYSFDGYYVVSFNQLYISDKNHFYSKKIQYWQDFKDTGKIADEYTVALPAINKFEVSKGNYITVNQFRQDYLAKLKKDTVVFQPNTVRVEHISVIDERVKLLLNTSSSTGSLKVIPVLRLENKTESYYASLEGITLTDGMPSDYSGGQLLNSGANAIVMSKKKGEHLKSLTLFVINQQNKLDQITTYFVTN